ncbi:Heterokaryon incompatibility [Fusarium austroafricanum]|uniref:Heterokaryon incompatibility n=1 Tax=Fusarium austroafricanum TaxID=2364996 RepID=A0A8H4P9U3_9HYPO|nr:Heterokaryon incompatibility [Fusarium austroafricanum]
MADRDTPHWLLDIREWRLYEYAQLDPENRQIEYGIVSYTWGMWRDTTQSAAGKPENVRWDVPFVQDLPLTEAREVMLSMNMQYVWWDWMCVPQRSERNPLTPDEIRLAGEEIAKQINIEAVRYCVKRIQEEEPWLTSGWTLQEGVLLPNTPLLDRRGNRLRFGEFLRDNAVVSSISASINRLAEDIAKSFVYISWQDYSTESPPPGLARILEFIAAAPENGVFLATFLADLLRTGLVGYTKNAPLFILSGRVSRRFACPEDHYWALLGAMEITVANPWYNDGRGIGPVIAAFFGALLERHQWRLFLMAKMDQRAEWHNRGWSERISEGHALPLEIYLGTVTLFTDLPQITLDGPDALLLKPLKSEDPGKKPKIIFIDKDQPLYTRRHHQSTYMNGFIHIDAVEHDSYTNSIFLPIANVEPLDDIDKKDKKTSPWQKVRKDYRCIEIEHLAESSGRFLGVADVWAGEAGEQGKPVTKELFYLIDFDDYKLF